jgi:hypothetical protein
MPATIAALKSRGLLNVKTVSFDDNLCEIVLNSWLVALPDKWI